MCVLRYNGLDCCPGTTLPEGQNCTMIALLGWQIDSRLSLGVSEPFACIHRVRERTVQCVDLY